MRKTLLAKLLLGAVGVLVLEGFLFQTLAPSLLGIALLAYYLHHRWRVLEGLKRLHFTLDRRVLELAAYAEEPLNVQVTLEGGAPGWRHRLTEPLPPGVRHEGGALEAAGTLAAPVSLRYTLLPKERGTLRWDPATVHLTCSHGLFTHTTHLPRPTETRVHASKEAIRRGRRLARRNPLESARKSIRIRVNQSTELEGIRQYVPGDRMRDIDWKASSRFMDLSTRSFLPEGEATLILLLDASRSMRQRRGGLTKLDHAATLAVELAEAAAKANLTVGALVYDEARIVTSMPASSRSGQGQRLLTLLADLPPNIPITRRLIPAGTEGQLTPEEQQVMERIRRFTGRGAATLQAGVQQALARLATQHAPGTLQVVAFSDFETAPRETTRALASLAGAQHTCTVALLPASAFESRGGLVSLREVEASYLARTNRKWARRTLGARDIPIAEIGPQEGADAVTRPNRAHGHRAASARPNPTGGPP